MTTELAGTDPGSRVTQFQSGVERNPKLPEENAITSDVSQAINFALTASSNQHHPEFRGLASFPQDSPS
jgi:hypothetical protein